MKFEKESTVTHPPSVVLDLMINRMDEIAPFLPNVDEITLISRDQTPEGRPHIVRKWQGNDRQAPKAVRPFIKKETLAWIDDAVWHPQDHKVHWTLSTNLGRLYDCSGINYFEPHPDNPEGATRIRITGDLVVYPDKVPGVPKFLAKRLAPQVEKFIVNLITPNLTDVADGLQGYLDAQGDR